MKKDEILTFKNLSHHPEITHGFSCRGWGNLWAKNPWRDQNLRLFLKDLEIEIWQLVVARQIHSGNVEVVAKKNRGKIVSSVDGIITQDKETYLGVHVADCLPIFFYDPENKIVAICHAGWKGTLEEIAWTVVEKMKKLGSRPEEVRVGIGPHIKVCCYSVSEERVDLFESKFGEERKSVRLRDGRFYLDLTHLNLRQLKRAGVKSGNIEVLPYCTCCDKDKLFSYWRQGSKNFSEMLGVIGLR